MPQSGRLRESTPDLRQASLKHQVPRSRETAASSAPWAGWLVIAGLLMLGLLPLTAGALRLAQLAGVAQVMPVEPRFAASPLPVVLHVASAAVYTILGAFQFAAGFRRRWPGWHRVAGRLLVPAGLLVGLSAVWMTLFYPRAGATSDLLYAARILFGSGMIAAIALGYVYIRKGRVSRHRAWMTRAFALGLAAGTQMVNLLVWELVVGTPDVLAGDILRTAGWVMNLVVAEWAIRRWPTTVGRRGQDMVLPMQ